VHGRPVARAAILRHAPPADLAEVVARALAEDVGAGDLTAALVPAGATALARIVAREATVLAGRPYAEAVFRQVEPRIVLRWYADDGDRLEAGAAMCELEGPARGLLTGERTALNFLQTLSATATATARYVEAVAGTGCTVLDTRKTLPGLRLAQKYAVRCGGGSNHRLGLYDGILIKENHIAAAGSIAAAVAAARAAGAGVTVEVEVESLAELAEALEAGPDVVMLDDFTLTDMAAKRSGEPRPPAAGEARGFGRRGPRGHPPHRRDRRGLRLRRRAHEARSRHRPVDAHRVAPRGRRGSGACAATGTGIRDPPTWNRDQDYASRAGGIRPGPHFARSGRKLARSGGPLATSPARA
jgi:nicotinate-nucleotide pyrophosphorylase (carboxylating)